MMKKLLIGLLSVSLLSGFVTGCGHTPVASMTQVNKVTITTVNTGMSVWADYVNRGFATTEQIQTVKKAYNTYYDAQQVFKGSIVALVSKKDLSQSDLDALKLNSDAITNAENALLKILNDYLK